MTFDRRKFQSSEHLKSQQNIPAPAWVPTGALRYLAHIEAGLPLRAVARLEGCHASTVLRQIRDIENRRDDPLTDEAMRRLSLFQSTATQGDEKTSAMRSVPQREDSILPNDPVMATGATEAPPSNAILNSEGRRILRRLVEPGSVLAVAEAMDKAVVVRELESGPMRTAVVDRSVAQAMALKEWIACDVHGRISRYRITATGRSALAKLLAEAENLARQGMAEGQAHFAGPDDPRETVASDAQGGRRRVRYSAVESPLLALSRRRDKTGEPFLSDELVRAGERLREDFELAQMEPKVTQNWDGFLTGGVQGGSWTASEMARGPAAARSRMMAALKELGPGLGDVALRCCCYLEGLETAERRMGWSARSGKIVLRIALQRLRHHYEGQGPAGSMMG